MKDEEVRRVSVNHCMRDSEIEELERACADADPGDWRVCGPEDDPHVARYGDKPFERRQASMRLMARAVTAIPRLIKGIRVLEEALRSAWISASIAHRELREERERGAEELARAFKGQTGPELDMDVLAEAIELGVFSHQPGSIGGPRHRRDWLASTLKAWASGVSIQEHPRFRIDLEDARHRRAERDRFEAEWEAQVKRERAEVRVLLEELKLKKREREALAAKVKTRVDAEGS